MVIGVLLLVDSERVMRWNCSSTAGTRRARQYARWTGPIDIKRSLYRWHRVLGVVVFAVSLYTLDVLVFGFQTSALVRALRDVGSSALLSLAFEGLRLFLIAGNVAALVAAAILVFRPSLLKGLEGWGDRDYTLRVPTRALDVMRYQPDDFVRRRPRLVGALLLIGGAYVLITFWPR